MIVSWNWLKEYIDINTDVDEFCERMIMSGSNLETCTEVGTGLKGVVIGKIESIKKHPQSDNMVVCTMNVGKDHTVEIVTGAKNVFEGAFVPVALDGSHIPGPLHGKPKVEGGVDIKKGEIKGVESCGMLCSASELGFSDKVAPLKSKDGIWILDGDWSESIGEEIQKAMEFKDYSIDFEITPNRPDCLSMIGMARETAATLGGKLKYPDTSCSKTEGNVADYIDAEIKSPICRRYTARVIKDVKIEQSPWWFQKKLMSAGMRPINNIVDITNWIMMEYGQPLHAFDIREIKGRKIIVDTAHDGEVFTTLDGKNRKLTSDMLMIKDGERSVGLAGIMGGLNSEILDDTNTVVLESANFVGHSIRTTSKALGMRTEAASRYEKDIDVNLCKEAADRFCHLVEKLGAGVVIEGAVDIYPEKDKARKIDVRVSRINKVLGTDISRDEMTGILKSLECKVAGDGDVMVVQPPSVRQDLNAEVDFVEEVARIYGYDNLPMTLPLGKEIAGKTESWNLREIARDALCAMGANETQTFSFVSPDILDGFVAEDSWERAAAVKIINPLGEDTSVMRTIITPSMLEVLGRNISRKVERVRAFEIGTTFTENLFDQKGLPVEDFNICIGIYGEQENFFTLKGMVEALLEKMGVKKLNFVAEKEYGLYHPGRCARISAISSQGEEIEIGIMGEIHPDFADRYDIDERVYVCELMMSSIEALSDREVHYSQPPKFPSISRDIAVVVDEECTVAQMEEAIWSKGSDILESVRMFDIYRGEQVGEGSKSVAFSLTYRHREKTLTDAECDAVHEEVIKALQEEVNGKVRDN